jgi:hypothetical protein
VIAAHEEGVSFQFDILDSMRLLRHAWYMVEPETIINCYKSVGLHTGDRNEEQRKTNDSSDFPSSNADKNDWDALMHCISIPDGLNFHDYVSTDDNAAVSEVPSDRDTVAAVSDRAVTDDSDDEREIGVCELESERQIVTTKYALRAFKVITEYYDAHCADDNLDIKLYCIEKDLQKRLSNTKKQTDITDFFTLEQNNV